MTRISGNHNKLRSGKGQSFSRTFQGHMVLLTPWFWTINLQNSERINFNFLNPLFVVIGNGNRKLIPRISSNLHIMFTSVLEHTFHESHISAYPVSRGIDSFWARLSFQGCLNSKKLWETESLPLGQKADMFTVPYNRHSVCLQGQC